MRQSLESKQRAMRKRQKIARAIQRSAKQVSIDAEIFGGLVSDIWKLRKTARAIVVLRQLRDQLRLA